VYCDAQYKIHDHIIVQKCDLLIIDIFSIFFKLSVKFLTAVFRVKKSLTLMDHISTRKDFAEESKIVLDTGLKIILLES